jgi:polysaccharide biosynthesis transport protein
MNDNSATAQRAAFDIQVSSETFPAPLPRDRSNGGVLDVSLETRNDRIAQEEHVKLVQRVFLGPAAGQPRVVVFAGIDPNNGCSRVCKRTAEVLASASLGTVCLVDADFHTPHTGRDVDSPSVLSLTETLAHGGPVRSYAHKMETHNLWQLACGSVNSMASKPIPSDVVRVRLQELRQEFDRVLIDAPPLNLYSDAVALAQLVDGLILIIEADVTRRETAREVTENLRQAGVKILGAVLNKRTYPIPERLYQKL